MHGVVIKHAYRGQICKNASNVVRGYKQSMLTRRIISTVNHYLEVSTGSVALGVIAF